MDYKILSVYRRTALVSNDQYETGIHRIEDVESDEYLRGGRTTRGGYRREHEGNARSPQMMLLNTTTLDKAVLRQSPFLRLFRSKVDQNYSQI